MKMVRMAPRPVGTLIAVGIGLFGVAGCGGQDESESDVGVVVSDSAGITIVENGGDVWSTAEQWRLAAEPDVRIGVAEGEEPFLLDGVRAVRLLDDGRILIANGGDNTLRWYDAGGEFLFQRGGQGEGPGEFARLGGVTMGRGDTLIATDWSGRRLTMFTSDGTLVRTTPITGLTGPPGEVHALPDGSLVTGISGFSTQQLGSGPPEEGVHRLPSPLLRLSPDGERADTIGMFPGMEIEVTSSDRGFRIGAPRLGKRLSYTVNDDRIYLGTQDRFEIDVFSIYGTLERSIRAPDVDVAVGPEYETAFMDFLRSRLASLPEDGRAEAERTLAEIELPATAPAYSTFFTDSGGNLWVGEYRFDLEPAEKWLVFDPDGRLITAVSTPPSFRPMAVTDGRIAGRVTDDLGVEQVVVYSLER